MKKRGFEYFCDNIENVENYEAAKKDNFKGWNCHHRLETHNSDGERRLVDISMDELVALGMYYHRPASELIFMTTLEHKRLHLKGKSAWNKGKQLGPFSEETKRKMSATKKGKPSGREGKTHSEETKKKISEAMKGKPSPYKGKHWKLVDGKRVYY